MSVQIAKDFDISASLVSYQATLAGLIIGVGAVLYSSLADSFSTRKLFIWGIYFICIGSVIGYVFHSNFYAVLAGRVIQTAGLAAAETLYVVYVAKYALKNKRKFYFGLSTSMFSLSLIIGILSGGYISTFLHWRDMFLISLIVILTLPFLYKYLPKETPSRAKVDILGLILISSITTLILLAITNNAYFLIPAIILIAFFAWHIRSAKEPLVDPSFFKNKRFVLFLIIVFVMYSIQLGYVAFIFPFSMDKVYGISFDKTSLLLTPGYIGAVIIGAFSGFIARFLSSKTVIVLSFIAIALALSIPAFFIGSSKAIFVISVIFFAGSYAAFYAPLLNEAIRDVRSDFVGVSIGLYNLMINISISIGIAITASLIDRDLNFFGNFYENTLSGHYDSILLLLGGFGTLGLILFLIFEGITKNASRAK